MAGDWIKVECATPDKPEIDLIAEELGLDPDTVLGKLVRLFVWIDQQLTAERNAHGVTKSSIDRITGVSGFAKTMAADDVGWLIENDGGRLTFANFDTHNGQPAKTRALTARRGKVFRQRSHNGESVTEALPEKRRGEKSLESPKKDSGGVSKYEKELLSFLDLIVDEWASLFPGKPQPRKSAKSTRTKLRSRFKCREFRAQWKPALVAASESPHLTEASWFDFGYFINNDDNWEKCLHRKWAWKDEQATTAAGAGLPADLAASLGGR